MKSMTKPFIAKQLTASKSATKNIMIKVNTSMNRHLIICLLALALLTPNAFSETPAECRLRCQNEYLEDLDTCDINAAEQAALCPFVCLLGAPAVPVYLGCVLVCDGVVLVAQRQCYRAAKTARTRCLAGCGKE